MAAYAEKRRHGRVSVDIPANWGPTPDCPKQGRVLSLSVGGYFLFTPEDVEAGSGVYLDLALPGFESLAGEVRRRAGGEGLGVEFNPAGWLTSTLLANMVDFYSKRRESTA